MKIVGINASYTGKKGYTSFLLDKVIEGARIHNAECQVFNLAELQINHCISCHHCQDDANVGTCIFDTKDDIRMIFNAMAEADLVIYATPVYFYQISALLKIFFERMYCLGRSSKMHLSKSGHLFHETNRNITCKPFVYLTCFDNIEDEIAQTIKDYFKTMSIFLDAPILGEIIRNGGAMVGHGVDSKAEAEFPRIKDVYSALRTAGEELVLKGKISIKTQKRTNRELIPVPGFKWLKRMWFFKPIILREANKIQEKT